MANNIKLIIIAQDLFILYWTRHSPDIDSISILEKQIDDQ